VRRWGSPATEPQPELQPEKTRGRPKPGAQAGQLPGALPSPETATPPREGAKTAANQQTENPLASFRRSEPPLGACPGAPGRIDRFRVVMGGRTNRELSTHGGLPGMATRGWFGPVWVPWLLDVCSSAGTGNRNTPPQKHHRTSATRSTTEQPWNPAHRAAYAVHDIGHGVRRVSIVAGRCHGRDLDRIAFVVDGRNVDSPRLPTGTLPVDVFRSD
jgi:hypothetical protein